MLRCLQNEKCGSRRVRSVPVKCVSCSVPFFRRLQKMLLRVCLSSTASARAKRRRCLNIKGARGLTVTCVTGNSVRNFRFHAVLARRRVTKCSREYIGVGRRKRRRPIEVSGCLTTCATRGGARGCCPLYLPAKALSTCGSPCSGGFALMRKTLSACEKARTKIRGLMKVSRKKIAVRRLRTLGHGKTRTVAVLGSARTRCGTSNDDGVRDVGRDRSTTEGTVHLVGTRNLGTCMYCLPSPSNDGISVSDCLGKLRKSSLQTGKRRVRTLVSGTSDNGMFLCGLLRQSAPQSATGNERSFSRGIMSLDLRDARTRRTRVVHLIERRSASLTRTVEHGLGSYCAPRRMRRQRRRKRHGERRQRTTVGRCGVTTHGSVGAVRRSCRKAMSTVGRGLSAVPSSTSSSDSLGRCAQVGDRRRHGGTRRRAPVKMRAKCAFFSQSASSGNECDDDRLLLPTTTLACIYTPDKRNGAHLLRGLTVRILSGRSGKSANDILFFALRRSGCGVRGTFLGVCIDEGLGDRRGGVVALGECGTTGLPSRRTTLFSGAIGCNVSCNSFLRRRQTFGRSCVLGNELQVCCRPNNDVTGVREIVECLDGALARRSNGPVGTIFVSCVRHLGNGNSCRKSGGRRVSTMAASLVGLSIRVTVPFILDIRLGERAASPLSVRVSGVTSTTRVRHSNGIVLYY